MEITTGALGLSIPVQNPSTASTVKFTPADILNWRNALEMADLSATTKKLYQILCEGSQHTIQPKDRLEILELLRPTIQFICQSLSKHYAHQPHALTSEQFTIANLCQTLQLEMAYGYKIIIEQTASNPLNSDLKESLLPIAIARVFYYFSQILVRSYKIYSPPPLNVWRELHLLYRYLRNNLPQREDLIEDYKHILLFAGSYPAHLRQNEQEALYRGTEIWAPLASFSNKIPNSTGTGYLIVDTAADHAPLHPSRGQVAFSDSCEVLQVHGIANRLKNVLDAIEPNELQSRMDHYNQAEYAIPSSVLKGLIKAWGMPSPRTHERVAQHQSAQVCAGLRATHFYVNHGQSFQMPKSETPPENAVPSSGQIEWVAALENTDELGTHIDFSNPKAALVESTELYIFYASTIVNETPTGYSLTIETAMSSALQVGEVLGLKRDDLPNVLEICSVRWLQYESNVLRLGIERLSASPKAAAIQLIKNKKTVGDYVRCLILDSTLVAPILPFKKGDLVNLIENELEEPNEYVLNELVDATGGYKRFQFAPKQNHNVEHRLRPKPVVVPSATQTSGTSGSLSTGNASDKQDPFDQIWSKL